MVLFKAYYNDHNEGCVAFIRDSRFSISKMSTLKNGIYNGNICWKKNKGELNWNVQLYSYLICIPAFKRLVLPGGLSPWEYGLVFVRQIHENKHLKSQKCKLSFSLSKPQFAWALKMQLLGNIICPDIFNMFRSFT